MIKRMNKITSLLVAGAAVVSLVPVSGVNAATKLETKDGTVKQAVAFDGGYIYSGYKTTEDETGVYYNTGDVDKVVEDLHSDTMNEYGTKYAKVMNDGDEYLVDLTTGKVIEDTSDDNMENVKAKLKSALSKTDRYGKVKSTAEADMTLTQISEGQFGATWYSYTATGAQATVGYNGYVNQDGKYIDTDVTANLSVVVNTDNGKKIVKIKKFGVENTDYKLTATLDNAITIAQDNDYIYRVIDVTIADNSKTTTSPAVYLQKISKAQGLEEDGAYVPSSVASYEITDAFASDNGDKAYYTLDALKVNDKFPGVSFRVINGVVYATRNNGDSSKVTVTTLKLMKDKVALNGSTDKLDTYLVEQDVEENQDIMGPNAVSIDAVGNTWALNKGEILKFDGTEFKAVYNCDRAFNSLDVYNQDSLIAWEDGQDAYAVVGKKAVEAPVETPVTNKGWVNTASGWTFYKADGSQVKGEWVNDGGVWYMIKADGIMATGWYKDNGTWYYLQSSGAMKTGWLNDNGTWYFLNGSGAMQTGWYNDNGTWYYLNASGAMAANTVVDGYKLGASGAWAK